MTRIIIAGSRDFDDWGYMCSVLKQHGIYNMPDVEIVSGHCRGADMLGEEFAIRNGYPRHIFIAEWDRYGKAAGPIRNREMASYASAADRGILFAFPVGESRGTRNMIGVAKEFGLEVVVADDKRNS